MARPKKTKTTEVDDITVVKDTKSGKFELNTFLIPLSDLLEKQGRVFPTTTSLDIALGGGIPEGTSVLISGCQGLGKTSLALHYIAQCHKIDPTKKVFYFDVEGRLRLELVNCYKNINHENFSIIKSNETKILTAEDYLNLLYGTLKDYPHSICILDSLAALCPESENSTNIGDSVKMAGTASLMYKMFRKTSQILSVTKATYIALTHMVANPNPGPGKRKFSVGGNAPQYGASIWLEVPWKEEIADSANNTLGHIMHVNVVKSAMSPPGKELTVPLLYGHGVSMELDVLDLCINTGIIEQAGAWYTMDNGEKFQGKMNMVKYLKDKPNELERLEDKLKVMSLPNYESKITQKS